MDGVVVDSEPVKFLAYRKVFDERFGVALPEDDITWRGKSEPEVMAHWLKRFNLPPTDVAELVTAKREAYRALVDQGRLSTIPGVVDFLRSLRDLGIRRGLATASNQEDKKSIFRRFDLDPLFDATVTLEEVPRSKPAPDLYLEAARRVGVSPDRCLVFEDSPSGVAAAREAGMDVVVVLTSFAPDRFDPRFPTIHDFNFTRSLSR